MSQWSDYYKSRIGETYPKYVLTRYKEFIDAIISEGFLTIREEGCGISSVSKALSILGINVTSMFDIDKDQIEFSRINLNSDKPYVGNIFSDHSKVDLIFSHGVLEHFSDENIRNILNRQKREAKRVVHYVPSAKYEKPSFGDERLLTVDYWKKIFNPINIIEFNGGYDLCLIF